MTYADHPGESGLGHDVRPQPVQPKDLVHMVKEQIKPKKDKGELQILTQCGMVGPPRTMHRRKNDVCSTIWNQDVTCPACKRAPSVRKYIEIERSKA